MRRFRWLGLITALMTVALLLRADFWLLPPAQKFQQMFRSDFREILQEKPLKDFLPKIKSVNFSGSSDVPVDWFSEKLTDRIPKNPNGVLELNIFVIYFVEEYRYGATVNLEVVHLTSGNRIWESGRTYLLGWVY